ncbi:MAG TPA: hypothetical protein VJV40_08540 [Thermodesulfobacteriota bacterium]|nr:hypothetical protein [Thermodesulfobacteriota bacterium]
MRNTVPLLFLLVLLLFPVSNAALAGDYLSEAVTPSGAEDRSDQLYPVNDFDDVIFNREYFYTLEEGKVQYDRSGGTTWKTLDFDLGIFGKNRGNKE